MDFDVMVHERILKPVHVVFGAVVDHRKMCQLLHFGRERAHSAWHCRMGVRRRRLKALIDVLQLEENRKIVLESSVLGPRLRPTIQFEPDPPDATVVTVRESKFQLTEGVKLALGQNAGRPTLCEA
jgi:hypothetical protein